MFLLWSLAPRRACPRMLVRRFRQVFAKLAPLVGVSPGSLCLNAAVQAVLACGPLRRAIADGEGHFTAGGVPALLADAARHLWGGGAGAFNNRPLWDAVARHSPVLTTIHAQQDTCLALEILLGQLVRELTAAGHGAARSSPLLEVLPVQRRECLGAECATAAPFVKVEDAVPVLPPISVPHGIDGIDLKDLLKRYSTCLVGAALGRRPCGLLPHPRPNKGVGLPGCLLPTGWLGGH